MSHPSIRPKLLNAISIPKVALWVLGLILIAAGVAIRPKAVMVELHPPRDLSTTFWRGRLASPAVPEASYFRSVLINHYSSPPFPFPEKTPRFRALFRMQLVVKEAGLHTFELDSPWFGALDIEGERVFGTGPMHPGTGAMGTIVLTPGVHEACLWAQPDSDSEAGIRLLWQTPGETLRPVEPRDLTSTSEPAINALGVRFSSALIWMGGLLIGIATLCWILSLPAKPSAGQKALVVVFLGFLSLATRSANVSSYPRLGLDEVHNAWAGWNLIHEGQPKTWSWLPAYTEKEWKSWYSYEYPIVPRSFDHPPLLPLLAGATTTLLGAETMFDCTPARIRPLMVVIGTLSVILLFFVCERLTNTRIGFLAAVLMATSPGVVFNTRVAKEDCLVALFWLAALYVYLKLEDAEAPRYLEVLCGVLLGVAALSKTHGIAVSFGLAAAWLVDGPRDLTRAMRIFGVALAVACLYPLYGLLIDADTYRSVVTWLSSNYPFEDTSQKFHMFPKFIYDPKLGNVAGIDGWLLLGWLALPFLPRSKPTRITFVSYLLILMTTLRSDRLYGFYLIPVQPFLCMAAAQLIRRALTKQTLISVFLFIVAFFLPTFGILAVGHIPFGYRGMLVVACLPLATASLAGRFRGPSRMAGQVLMGSMLILGVLAAIHRCFTTM